MSTQLTPTQHAILVYAHEHNEGKVVWFPDNLRGGAQAKTIESLTAHKLVTRSGDAIVIAPHGYAALGVEPPANQPKARKMRENSKQSQVIAMLKRPEGATIAQICEATGWQQHTVRGTFAGAFKKKLGLAITSAKEADGERVYRVD